MTNETGSGHANLPPLRALFVLLGLVVVIAGYLVLAHLLGIHSPFAGLFLVFYLFAVEGGAVRAFPKALIGALGGLANGALFALPGLDAGLAGLAALAGLIVALVAVYCLLIGFAPILFNQAYMLVLTVVCIPAVALEADFTGMLAALVLSGLYFGSIVWGLHTISNRKASASPPPSNQT
jgi:hypothetical protein